MNFWKADFLTFSLEIKNEPKCKQNERTNSRCRNEFIDGFTLDFTILIFISQKIPI